MSTPAVVLELIGQALLPVLASAGEDPSGSLDLARLARDIWGNWARERAPAERQADLTALGATGNDSVSALVAEVIKRVLPGKPDPLLARYLAVLPPLARRFSGSSLEHADDLLRWLPPRVPALEARTRPAGIGERELVEPLCFTASSECWLASNPRLPNRPPVPLLFFPDPTKTPLDVLSWHQTVAGVAGIVVIEHTFLTAPIPCLQFERLELEDLAHLPTAKRTPAFRSLVETVARLHRLSPMMSPGVLGLIHVAVSKEASDPMPRLLVIDPPSEADPRLDVYHLGRLGQRVLWEPEKGVVDLLNLCVSPDALQRPADAGELLARLSGAAQMNPPELQSVASRPSRPDPAPSRPRHGRGADVWKVLDSLQKAEPERPKVLSNSVGMKFVLIPAGTFKMGAQPGEIGRRDNEGPVHEVVLTRPLYLAIHPVTQEQYAKVIGVNPARFQGAAGGGQEFPVECVSWDDAVAYCSRLSELAEEKQAGHSYRLPTEAEWEYSCRAGTTTAFHFGDSLAPSQASFDGHHPYGDAERGPSLPRTARVGSFPANHYGLHDMHGNVWEWCSDWYDAGYYQRSSRQDPQGPPAGGPYRVLRGGSWRNQATTCRSSYRNALAPNQRQPFIGFRLVLEWNPPVSGER